MRKLHQYTSLFIGLMCISSLALAKKVNFTYEVDEKSYTGTVEVIWWAKIDAKKDTFITNNPTPILHFRDPKAAKITARFKNLTFAKAEHQTLTLYISKLWGGSGLKAPELANRNLKVGQSIDIPYKVQERSSGSIIIHYQIKQVQKKQTLTIGKGSAKKSYTIVSVKPKINKPAPPTPEESKEDQVSPPNPTTVDKDEAAWKTAFAANTIDAYKLYLKKFPNGKHRMQAKKNMNKIKSTVNAHLRADSMAWMKAKQGDLTGIAKFIQNHPQSHFIKDAMQEVEKRDEKHWQKVKSRSNPKSIQDYLQNFTFPFHSPIFEEVATAQLEKLNAPLPEYVTDWNQTRRTNTLEAYQTYLEKHPGKFTKDLVERIDALSPIQIVTTREKNQFALQVLHVLEPEFTLSGEDGLKHEWDEETQTLHVTIHDHALHTIYIRDARGKTTSVRLDASTEALQVQLAQQSESLFFQIIGGIGPYVVRFFKEGETFYRKELALTEADTIMMADIPEIQGVYTLRILDSRRTESVEFVAVPMNVSSRKIPYWAWIALALALVAGVSWLYRHQKEKQKEEDKKLFEQKYNIQQNKRNTEKATQQRSIAPVSTKRNINSFKIKRKHTPEVAEKRLPDSQDFLQNPASYYIFPLSTHWDDSAIKQVYMHPNCVQAIDEFIQQGNKSMVDESKHEVPEIGGFLLGEKYFLEEEGQYKVAITKFVPITPEMNNAYQIEFGARAWVELDRVREKYPQLRIIGWFHTHPGHGLFLSKPDLKIHQGFFRETYTLAMEIDTLSEGLDTAFFTRTREGQINNIQQKKEGTHWFRWADLKLGSNS